MKLSETICWIALLILTIVLQQDVSSDDIKTSAEIENCERIMMSRFADQVGGIAKARINCQPPPPPPPCLAGAAIFFSSAAKYFCTADARCPDARYGRHPSPQ